MESINKNHVGVITDYKLGCNIAMNIANNDYTVSLYYFGLEEMLPAEIDAFKKEYNNDKISIVYGMESFSMSISCPRRIFLITQNVVFEDAILDELLRYLNSDDTIIDTCDYSFKPDSERYTKYIKKGINFMPTGFSGGESAALYGGAFMVGGSIHGYEHMKDVLSDISSKVDNFICCPYFGTDGAGQFVKMIHNGIEYSVLELITEAIYLLQNIAACSSQEVSEILTEWNSGDLSSYFLETAADITSKRDKITGSSFLDVVLDSVEYNNSVSFLCIKALELGLPASIIYESLNQRIMSKLKAERIASSKLIKKVMPKPLNPLEKKSFINSLRNSLYMSVMCAYVQSFALLNKTSASKLWNANLLAVAKTFQGNSYIRSRINYRIIDALEKNKNSNNLFTDAYFQKIALMYVNDLREILSICIKHGLSVPAMNAALIYIDTYSTMRLPTGTISLIRDYIGLSGYYRIDSDKRNHAEWENPESIISSSSI